jgi:myo-inositol-1-phosphate synthase
MRRSKEITKTGLVEDMVGSNAEVFPGGKGPDHLIVIKYVPSVGDSKRAMDEYVSAIGMGGLNTLVIHNTCEDSLLAAPIMLDLFVFMELFQRMTFTANGENVGLDMGTVLGYWLKAPLTSMTNSLFRQRACIENLVRAAVSLPPNSHLHLDVGRTAVNAPKVKASVSGTPVPNGNGIHSTDEQKKMNGIHMNGNLSGVKVKA